MYPVDGTAHPFNKIDLGDGLMLAYLIRICATGIPSSFSTSSRNCLNVVSTDNVSMHCLPSDVERRTFLSVRLTCCFAG